MEMECIDKEGNEIIIGDTNGDSIAKRQSWREDDCSTCATNSDFNLDELFLMNPGTLSYISRKALDTSERIGINRDEWGCGGQSLSELLWRRLSLIFK